MAPAYFATVQAVLQATDTDLLGVIRELLEALETSPDDMDVCEYETIVAGAKASARKALK